MKIGVVFTTCALALLTGCGAADQYATFIPKILRQPSTEPPQPDPEPDVKAWVHANADTLFTAHPSALAVSRPRRITGRGFSICVKAIVVGPMNPTPQPITLLVIIEHGKLADRHRATAQDGCNMNAFVVGGLIKRRARSSPQDGSRPGKLGRHDPSIRAGCPS